VYVALALLRHLEDRLVEGVASQQDLLRLTEAPWRVEKGFCVDEEVVAFIIGLHQRRGGAVRRWLEPEQGPR
jgi:hypothetical protein